MKKSITAKYLTQGLSMVHRLAVGSISLKSGEILGDFAELKATATGMVASTAMITATAIA